MKFFSNESQHDDLDQISAQSVYRLVNFKKYFYLIIVSSFKPLTNDTVNEKALIKLISGSLTKSKPVGVTTKDDSEQTLLLDTTPTTYNQIVDSNKDQVIRLELNAII
jgi:hypothetical protein